MSISSNADRGEFHRVVLRAEPSRGQEKPQDLWIGLRRPARQDVEKQKHHETAQQAVEQVEGGRAQAHREKEQLPLGSEDG